MVREAILNPDFTGSKVISFTFNTPSPFLSQAPHSPRSALFIAGPVECYNAITLAYVSFGMINK